MRKHVPLHNCAINAARKNAALAFHQACHIANMCFKFGNYRLVLHRKDANRSRVHAAPNGSLSFHAAISRKLSLHVQQTLYKMWLCGIDRANNVGVLYKKILQQSKYFTFHFRMVKKQNKLPVESFWGECAIHTCWSIDCMHCTLGM